MVLLVRAIPADINYHGQYLLSLLECQHQEKVVVFAPPPKLHADVGFGQPSVQKLIGSVAQDALVYLNEESCHTDAFTEPVPGVLEALEGVKQEFASPVVDEAILHAAAAKCSARVALKNQRYTETVCFNCSNELALVLNLIPSGKRAARDRRKTYNACK